MKKHETPFGMIVAVTGAFSTFECCICAVGRGAASPSATQPSSAGIADSPIAAQSPRTKSEKTLRVVLTAIGQIRYQPRTHLFSLTKTSNLIPSVLTSKSIDSVRHPISEFAARLAPLAMVDSDQQLVRSRLMVTCVLQGAIAMTRLRSQKRLSSPGLKEERTLGKVIGFLACSTLVAGTLWMAGSFGPFLTASAEEQPNAFPETAPPSSDQQAANARQLMDEARRRHARGDFVGASRLAGRASTFPIQWGDDEESPNEFLRRLNPDAATVPAANGHNPFLPAAAQTAWPKSQPTSQPQFVDRGQFTESPIAEPAKIVAPPNASPEKKQAVELLAHAYQDMRNKRYEEARSKALRAARLNVAWDRHEYQPKHIFAAIERNTGAKIIAPGPSADSRRESAASFGQFNSADAARPHNRQAAGAAWDRNEPEPESTIAALNLLKEARGLVQQGHFAEARAKAIEAQQLGATFTAMSDRPDLVLLHIDRRERMMADRRSNQGIFADSSSNPDFGQRHVQPAGQQFPSDQDRFPAPASTSSADRADNNSFAGDAPNNPFAPETNPFPPAQRQPGNEQPNQPNRFADVPNTFSPSAGPMAAGREPQLPNVPTQEPSAFPRNNTNAFAQQPDEDQHQTGDQSYPGTAPGMLSSETMAAKPLDPNGGQQFAREDDAHDDLHVISPTGVSADEMFKLGMRQLREGSRQAAYDSFLQAYKSGQKLDPYRRQQLQDMLRDLAPRKRGDIQLTSGETVRGANRSGPLGAVEQRQAAQYGRLRSEAVNAVFGAERVREKNPARALKILNDALASVENSDLSSEMTAPLVKQLTRSKTSVETYMEQRQPILEMAAQKEEVEKRIAADIEYDYRVEQDFAELVDKYNKLMDQNRFAEAELIAKQAKDLNPEIPQGDVMFWKARYAKRIQRDDETKLRKEDSWVRSMQDVDDDVINPVIDSPISYGDVRDWNDLKLRRKKYDRPDNRERSPQEERIEKSLNKPISLHFEEEPLSAVIQHIATVADINVMLDKVALFEDEQVTTDEPVSIDVDGIMLKSALNLVLDQFRLDYLIKDEVLKITSRIRQEGELETRVYSVADLVVPIPNFSPSAVVPNNGLFSGSATPAMGFGQMSLPSTGGLPQSGGQGFAQVNGGVPGGIMNPFDPQPAVASAVGGGASFDFDSLQQLIVTTVRPDSWSEIGGSGDMEHFVTTLSLVVRQTEKVHQEIADLLDQLRRLQDLQVTIEVRFITVSDQFFERIGVDFDFNIQDNVTQDTVGFPPFGFNTNPTGGGTAGTAGAAGAAGAGGAAAGAGGGALAGGAAGGAAGAAGGVGGVAGAAGGAAGAAGGAAGAAGGAAGATGGAPFNIPTAGSLLLPNLDNWPKNGSIVGLSAPDTFTQDLDIGFKQGSFALGVPDFGNFDPAAGIQVGMAILSDLEAFFFIQAAQADQRSNIMSAPKITLFNGQSATIQDNVLRPFVISLIPTVGPFAVGFTPQIQFIPDGVTLTVQAVVSADRRYVRLTVQPFFTQITDVFTFSFLSSGGGGAGGAAGGIGGGAGGGIGGGAGGGIGGGGIGGGAGGIGGAGGGTGLGFGGIGGGLASLDSLGLSLLNQIGGGLGGGGLGGGGVGGLGGGGVGGGGVAPQPGAGTGGIAGGVTAGNVTVQQPVTEVISVQTTVSVPDGGTVLLGGVKRLREGRNMAGVPILNKIPYISRLFKNTGVGRETSSIMLMVTPRIIIQEEEEELLEEQGN